MSSVEDIQLIHSGLEVYTKGLALRGHRELSVSFAEIALVAQGIGFLRYVAGYIIEQGRRISPGETLNYGFWLVKFELRDDRMLQAWEYNADATEFIPGATLGLTYWRDQHLVCESLGAEFFPARADQLAACSAGVIEGDPVQGVRYPSPERMSGWWITTDRYDGDIRPLRNEHLYHVTAARPDLARYLALPYGFRFDLSKIEDIWFDESVANEPE